jgi:hypothetical protein
MRTTARNQHQKCVAIPSIRLKVKAGMGIQTQEYIKYFAYWITAPNTEIGPEGRF